MAAQVISSFASNLPNTGGVVSWFTGDNTLSAFADELIEFGPKLAAYAASVSGLDSVVVTNSMIAANALSEFASNLPNAGGLASWFSGDNTLAKFGESMAEFGGYLMEYSVAISGINVSSFMAVIPGLTSLVNIARDISSINASSVGTFAESFVELATDGVSGFANAFTDSTAEIGEAIEYMLTSSLDYISGRKEDFKKIGSELVSQLASGAKSKSASLKTAFTSGLSGSVTAIRNYRWQFYQAGGYLVEGFVGGIDSNRWKAAAAAKAMAKAAEDAAKAELEQNSPSKKFYNIGSGTVEGMVNAMYDGIRAVYQSGTKLAEAAHKGTSEAIKKVADFVSYGMDAQPTIRPVLDLTDVAAGFGQLNTMFGHKQAISIGARMNNVNNSGSETNPTANGIGANYNFVQNNYSPKALNAAEIYRLTKNQFSQVKGWVPTK